ncbi:MAG: NAD(P)-dependent oxidoreductase [Mangrovicoccus sp.]
MTNTDVVHGVYLSETLDLGALYGAALRESDVVLRYPDEVTNPDDIRFAICWLPGEKAFAPYKNLELAMSIGAGVDDLLSHPGIDPSWAIARVRDPHQAELMAGYAVHEVLHYERQFGEIAENASRQIWKFLPMRPPKEAVVAVLGNGTMGQAVIQALKVLGFSLRVSCRSTPAAPLDGVTYLTGESANLEAAQGADYLINILPLTPATENVLNADLFARLNPGARLIQFGRGEHLVEADLIAALDAGQLGGATLDVFRTEPLPATDPFWKDPRLRITPHIASDSMPEIVGAQVIETARALRDGQPLRLGISRAQGY